MQFVKKKAFIPVLFICLILLTAALCGCSSSGGCDRAFVSTGGQSEGPRDEIVQTIRRLSVAVTYPDGEILPGVTVFSSNPSALLNFFIDESGHFTYLINPDVPDGTSFTLSFKKEGFIIADLTVVLDGDRLLLADGSFLYEKVVVGYMPFSAADLDYRVSTWRITGARFCTYCDGIVAIPGDPSKSPSLLANGFYMVDTSRNVIALMDAEGNYTLFAGSLNYDNYADGTVNDDGIGAAAKFSQLYSLAISADGKNLYATDGNRIRKIDTATRAVTTLVSFPEESNIYLSGGLALAGGYLYAGAETRILKIDISDGSWTVAAGTGESGDVNGSIADARFSFVKSLEVSGDGNIVYVYDSNDEGSIRKINFSADLVSTFVSPIRESSNAFGMALSRDGSILYVSDSHAVSAVNTATGVLTVFAGDREEYIDYQETDGDGIGTAARLDAPQGIALTSDGSAMFVLSGARHFIYNINIATRQVTTLLGGKQGYHGFQEGYATTVTSSYINDMVIAPDGRYAYFTNSYRPSQVLVYDFASGLLSEFAGKYDYDYADAPEDGIGTDAIFSELSCIAVSPDGRYLYVTDSDSVRMIEISGKRVTTIVPGESGLFWPQGIAVAPNGDFLYVADDSEIKKIEISSANVSVLAGELDSPQGLALSGDGSILYVATSGKIVAVNTANGTRYTVADGTAAGSDFLLQWVKGITLSRDGLYLYVVDNNKIASVEIASGKVTLVAGDESNYGAINGIGAEAAFNSPWGIAMAPDGSVLYVCDVGNSLVRRIVAVPGI